MRSHHWTMVVWFLGLQSVQACVVERVVTEPNDEEEPSAGTPPAAPSIMQLVPLAQEPQRGMHILINDASSNEDGFILQRRVQGGSFSQIADVSPNTESYDDWGLEASTSYTYRIRAYNDDGSSDWREKTGESSGPETAQVVLPASADSYVSSGSPALTHGQHVILKAAKYSDGGREEVYVMFASPIPEHATAVLAATLRMFSENLIGGGTPFISVDDLATSWSESTVNWNNRPIGRGLASDNQYVYNDGQPVDWNVTSLVQRWHDGTTNNNGFRLFASAESIAFLKSREADLNPSLSLLYEW